MRVNPLWILCHYRTGSSHLCDLLNFTGLFPLYDPGYDTGFYQRPYHEWLRLFVAREDFERVPPPHCKAISDQYLKLFGSEGPEYLQKILPGIKFVLLERDDLLAHAVSHYFTQVTGKHHLYTEEERDRYLSQQYEINEELLKQSYDNVVSWQGRWEDFKSDALVIKYESLIVDPLGNLLAILKQARLSMISAVDAVEKAIYGGGLRRLYPMMRPDTQKTIDVLRGLI